MTLEEFNKIIEESQHDLEETVKRLQEFLVKSSINVGEEAIRIKEQVIMKLCELYRQMK
jgi:ElaB/YqjD/DUF883 family membrane-anchored ribosome-binding protein